LKKYQAKAASEGVDPLGYYLPPFAFANLQVLAQAVGGTKSFDQDKLADLEQWKSADNQTIVWPAQYATGKTV